MTEPVVTAEAPEAPDEATEVPTVQGSPVPAAQTSEVPAVGGPTFVYALGNVEPRFPTLGIEKEFAQVLSQMDNGGATDRQALARVVGDRRNRYIARQLCWVFVIEGLETYILVPRDPVDLDLLIEAVRPEPTTQDIDVLIGDLGPAAPPEACNGLSIPMVAFEQLYSFDRPSFFEALPVPEGMKEREQEQFRNTANEVFDYVMQLADNAGATDEHRALNYLTVRDPNLYARIAEGHAGDASLTSVDVRPSRLSGVRRILDVIISLTNRRTDVTEKYMTRVDVTERHPFMVTKLSPYYDRD